MGGAAGLRDELDLARAPVLDRAAAFEPAAFDAADFDRLPVFARSRFFGWSAGFGPSPGFGGASDSDGASDIGRPSVSGARDAFVPARVLSRVAAFGGVSGCGRPSGAPPKPA